MVKFIELFFILFFDDIMKFFVNFWKFVIFGSFMQSCNVIRFYLVNLQRMMELYIFFRDIFFVLFIVYLFREFYIIKQNIL